MPKTHGGGAKNGTRLMKKNSAHLILWMLVYLRFESVRGSGNQSTSVMMTGRWSEQRVVSGCQVAPTVR